MAIMLLWWYAFKLKRKPLFGNLLVSFFCGGVALLVLFSERYALYKLMDANKTAYQLASNLFWFYAVFAFLSNLYRELLKDLEDQEGDRLAGCLTVPLAWGVRPALLIAFSTGTALLAVLLYFLAIRSFVPIYALMWAIITLVIPVFRNMLVLKPSSAAADFHHASQRAKYMMLSGLVLLPLLVWES
jgi:4-hydroxybenzoate polyprenyltransferase